MTLNDIVLKTIETFLRQADVDAFCEQEKMTEETFCDAFAQHVATRYLSGQLSYQSADIAIADLFGHFPATIPKFAFAVFECFDVGEWHATKGADPDKITRPLVQKLLAAK